VEILKCGGAFRITNRTQAAIANPMLMPFAFTDSDGMLKADA